MIIGIDIGTQSLKAVVTDGALKVLGESSRVYGVNYPKAGWAEQNPCDWEAALVAAVADALSRAGVSADDVKALGIVGQLDGCVAVGSDGLPVYPCIIWMDRRAERETRGIDPDEIREKTGNCLDAGHQAAKIRWLKSNCAGAAREAVFHQPVSYLVSRLTGAHVFDYGLASTTMLCSLETRDYDDALLDKFGIHREELPAIAPAHSVAGVLSVAGARLCGLPEGIPVAVGTGDDFSTPLGAGYVSPGGAVCVLGTAEVVGALDAAPKVDFEGLVETHCYANANYFVENPGWLSGGSISWFIKTFNISDVAEMERLAAGVPAGSDGVAFIPALSGAMAPKWSATARGCFYGMTAAHGTGHLARAVFEGCAFAMRDVLERLRALGTPSGNVMLLGGGAKSSLWACIRADVAGVPVVVPDRVDTSQMGAAMLAAVAGGLQSDLNACAALVREGSVTISPNYERREAYGIAYSVYRKLFDSLEPMF